MSLWDELLVIVKWFARFDCAAFARCTNRRTNILPHPSQITVSDYALPSSALPNTFLRTIRTRIESGETP